MTTDEGLILRRRMADQVDEMSRSQSPSSSGSTLVVTTTTVTTYPTAAQSYYAVQVTQPGGNQVEANAVVIAAASGNIFYAANLGNNIPPNGTAVRIDSVGGRWIFEY